MKQYPWTALTAKFILTAQALLKKGPQSIGKSKGGWTCKVHMVAANAGQAVAFSLTPGNAGNGPEGREMLEKIKNISHIQFCEVLMVKAYEGDAAKGKEFECDFNPDVSPKSNRTDPWQYDEELCKQRNHVERLFRRIKRFRRIFTRYDKTDIMYTAVITVRSNF